MDFDLAKELKEAGYPQPEPSAKGCYWAYREYENHRIALYYSVSLPELIEACGDEFMSLTLLIEGRDKNISGKLWWASSFNDEKGGQTPEEAVARLWIALNKKA